MRLLHGTARGGDLVANERGSDRDRPAAVAHAGGTRPDLLPNQRRTSNTFGWLTSGVACDADGGASTGGLPRLIGEIVAAPIAGLALVLAVPPSPVSPAAERKVSCPRLKPLASRVPQRYFPGKLAGLTTQRSAAGVPFGCVYLIPPHTLAKVPVWHQPERGRLRGPAWSPDGKSFAVSQKVGGAFYVFKVDLEGHVTLRTPGRDFAFVRSGDLLIRRRHSIFIEQSSGRFQKLASERALERAAGFRAGFYGSMYEVAGFGAAGVVVQWWAPAGRRGNVLLLVRPSGQVQAITPRWHAAGTYMPGPPSWSPDNRTLMIPWQHPPTSGPADHVHCLAIWTESGGYRNAFCGGPHFTRVVWAPDGRTALLENGSVVSATGRRLSPPRHLGPAFAVRWIDAR